MKLITLHSPNGNKVYINFDSVAFFCQHTYGENGEYKATTIATAFNKIDVSETPKEIIKELTK